METGFHLTKFEHARVIGMRTHQLGGGPDACAAAMTELRSGTIHVAILRGKTLWCLNPNDRRNTYPPYMRVVGGSPRF